MMSDNFYFVVMRRDLSGILSNEDGPLVFGSFATAHAVAENFTGYAMSSMAAREVLRLEQMQPESLSAPMPDTDDKRLEVVTHTSDVLKDLMEWIDDLSIPFLCDCVLSSDIGRVLCPYHAAKRHLERQRLNIENIMRKDKSSS